VVVTGLLWTLLAVPFEGYLWVPTAVFLDRSYHTPMFNFLKKKSQTLGARGEGFAQDEYKKRTT
jgi:hypothetical protein